MTDAARLVADLSALLSAKAPDLGPPSTLRSVGVRARRRSTFHVFLVGSPPHEHQLLVKVPRSITGGPAEDRPRLFRETDPADRTAFELEALQLVQRAVDAAGDPRLRAVRAIGSILDGRGLVMVADAGTPLSRLVLRHARWHLRRPGDRAERAFASAGAWLRMFHAIDDPGPVTVDSRDAYLGQLDALVGYVSRREGAGPKLAALAARLRRRADDVLPPTLPIGLRHGDFAMRNILASPDGAVAVIDMLTRWRAPIYDDLATMIIALRTNRPQAYSLGFAFGKRAIERFEAALLEGYGGGPDVTAGAYVAAAGHLLEKWAVRTSDREDRAPAATFGRRIFDRHYLRVAGALLEARPGG